LVWFSLLMRGRKIEYNWIRIEYNLQK
jgi:hypothetical protein